jgi:hypothetical protein
LHLEHGLDAESRRAALLRHCEEVLAETAYDAQGYVTNRSTSSCPDTTKLGTGSLQSYAPTASAPPPPAAYLQRSTSSGASAGARGPLATTPSTTLAAPVPSAPSIGANPTNSHRPFLDVPKLGGPAGGVASGGDHLEGGRALPPPSSQHSTAAPSPTATAAALSGAPGFADRMMASADHREQQSPPATVGASTALGSDTLGVVPMMGVPKPSQPPPRARPSTSAMRRPPPAAESHSLVVSSNNDLSQVSRVSAVTGEVAEVTPGAAVVDGGDVFY